ncbi:MAG: HAMP domain-containing protein [Microthrixaceae bacterium]|nr:HAMP domain-containing protein [Microthrixaceae bacterium]
MSLRLKLIVAMVALTIAATGLVGVATYRSAARELHDQIDRSLTHAVDELNGLPLGLDEERPRAGRALRSLRNFRAPSDVVLQAIGPRGNVALSTDVELPVSDLDIELAGSTGSRRELRTVTVSDQDYRMLTASIGQQRGAVQAARSLEEVHSILSGLSRRIVVAATVLAGVAALLGALIAGQLTKRLTRLTLAAEEVASTADPSVRVPDSGSDETGRLAKSFNAMLMALTSAREDQQRLVENAAHELRTPLTSLRTNVFALSNSESIDPEQRRRILDDLTTEAQELTTLMDEVIELATFRRDTEPATTIDLGALVESTANRVANRTGRSIEVRVDSSFVQGRPTSLARAVSNLIENSVKFDSSGYPIVVECSGGQVTVADRGPGIPQTDLPYIFDRFYRADDARSRPGSGLGLSIVDEIVRAHGGTTGAWNQPEGGAVVGFSLPVIPPVPSGPPVPPPFNG